MVREQMILRALLIILLATPAFADTGAVVEPAPSQGGGGLVRLVVLGSEIPPDLIAPIAAAPDTGSRDANDSSLTDSATQTMSPFIVIMEDRKKALLVRNPHFPHLVRPDTLLLLFENDIARGVFLVEAGAADIAPVGEDDFVRLSTEGSGTGRLFISSETEYLSFLPLALEKRLVEILRRAVNRPLINKVLLNEGGHVEGPPFLIATEEERAGLSDTSLLIETSEAVRARYRRILDRIAYDLKQSGIDVVFKEPGFEMESSLRIESFSESSLPRDALPLLSTVRTWFVSNAIDGFIPPDGAWPTVFRAGRRPLEYEKTP